MGHRDFWHSKESRGYLMMGLFFALVFTAIEAVKWTTGLVLGAVGITSGLGNVLEWIVGVVVIIFLIKLLADM